MTEEMCHCMCFSVVRCSDFSWGGEDAPYCERPLVAETPYSSAVQHMVAAASVVVLVVQLPKGMVMNISQSTDLSVVKQFGIHCDIHSTLGCKIEQN